MNTNDGFRLVTAENGVVYLRADNISCPHGFATRIGGVSALIPLTGVPLLFISSGGTALVSSYLTIGICQNVIANINRKELSSKEE